MQAMIDLISGEWMSPGQPNLKWAMVSSGPAGRLRAGQPVELRGRNLRMVDASVRAKADSANTNWAAIMVGVESSDMILAGNHCALRPAQRPHLGVRHRGGPA